MSTGNTYLAVFLGSKTSESSKAWWALPENERQVKIQAGMAAWGAWMQKNQPSIIETGGPLGKTKRVSARGVDDVTNSMSAFTLVRAESHEAAAKLFEDHPHFAIFPGDAIEIMPVLPVPGR